MDADVWAISQFEGGIEGGFFYHTSKTRELDEVVGDIFHKIMGKNFFRDTLVFWRRVGRYCPSQVCQRMSYSVLLGTNRSMLLSYLAGKSNGLLQTDMEQAILRDLERRVLIYASALRQAADVAAEIDWY